MSADLSGFMAGTSRDFCNGSWASESRRVAGTDICTTPGTKRKSLGRDQGDAQPDSMPNWFCIRTISFNSSNYKPKLFVLC